MLNSKLKFTAGVKTLNDPPPNPMHQAIRNECAAIAEFLIAKNESYGNSVSDPLMVFSQASASERMAVRLDDKLSRLAHGHEYPGDDTPLDIAGYIILERAIRRLRDD